MGKRTEVTGCMIRCWDDQVGGPCDTRNRNMHKRFSVET